MVSINKAMKADLDQTQKINSRFGEITIDRAKQVTFPLGLCGMPDAQGFCVTDLPVENAGNFKLLQSIDEDELSFITMPVDFENTVLDASDLEEACTELGIEKKNAAFLLIVTVHKDEGAMKISVNARAPIVMDAAEKAAVQYVFKEPKYMVQHYLA